jgi:hypothetical protein
VNYDLKRSDKTINPGKQLTVAAREIFENEENH